MATEAKQKGNGFVPGYVTSAILGKVKWLPNPYYIGEK